MMKHILAAIGLLELTYPAQAQNVLPPLEYDHPYKGKLTVERSTSQVEIRLNCPYSPFRYLLGCAKSPAEGECYILMWDDESLKKLRMPPEVVLRHETAHCNGWPADHRGGRWP